MGPTGELRGRCKWCFQDRQRKSREGLEGIPFESDIAYVEGSTSQLGDCTLFNTAVVLITV
jgi:hypothetical protein